MATVDDLEELSQQQQQRFYALFGANPATGEGFADVSNMGRQLGEQTKDTRSEVVNSRFSTAVISALANATAEDYHPFDAHARTAATAARVSDASAQINTHGAAAVLANSRNEAAQVAAIPDRDSPEGMIAALEAIQENQTKSLDTVEQSAAAEQQLGQQAAQGSGDDQHLNGQIHLVDDETKKGDDDKDGKGKGDDKGYGGSFSKGEGSKDHIHQNGEVEQQWGHPTDPHEWKPFGDVYPHSGTFDDGHGKWEWKGPGYQGGAEATKTTDGIGGRAGGDAWVAKADGGWSRTVLGQQLDATGHAELGAHANVDGVAVDHGISAGFDGFVGAEAGGTSTVHLGPVDLSLGATGQAGAGGSAHLDLGMQDNKLIVGGTLGAAWGLGGKISPHIAIDPKGVTDVVNKAEQWLEGLF